jgi:hypothetical protein
MKFLSQGTFLCTMEQWGIFYDAIGCFDASITQDRNDHFSLSIIIIFLKSRSDSEATN